MKAGGLYTAVGLLAVLGGLVWWTTKHPQTETKKAAESPVILKADPTRMEEIKITHLGSEPVVLKKVSDVWSITAPKAYAADSEVVSPLTGSLGTITSERLIDEHPANLDPFGLAHPVEEVDVTMKGGKVYKIQLGSDTPAGGNTFLKLADDPKVYTVSSAVKSDLDKSLNDLRDKRFMTFSSDKLTSIVLKAKGPEVDFTRNPDNDWQMVKPRLMRADNLLIDDMTRRLKDARMDMGTTYNEKEANSLFEAGAHIATVTTTEDGKTVQTFEVRRVKDKDGSYYAKSNLDPNAYKVVNDIGEGLDKDAEDFRAKKVFAFGFQDPTKLTINDKTYVKGGSKTEPKWTLNGVQFDPITIEDVFDKLRDASAAELTEKKGGTPTLTFDIVYGDKNHEEKVVFNKDGTTWRAMRGDDPDTVYVVDGKVVEDIQKVVGAIKQYQPPAKK
ncbi:MAG TPA: DUF4340 domain-containing protein [Bryobacteraceae bacterium]|nr:DUF4340 domain-containing protein [Bryobacteraceae bacterium]